ncbi:MAG TPA: hypothetical protein DHV93_05950 [Holophagaceae bacterium]|nr:hypothetical protein [Holophagaceae bacterium]
MHSPNYSHPAAPARAIPLGEEPLVTRAKVCAQLRAAIQILEGGAFDVRTIDAAKAQLQASQRVLFVAREEIAHQVIRVRLQIGQLGRERRA